MSESRVGRPTKYKEEYVEMLIDHMTLGLSFPSFAGKIGVHFDTLYEWVKVHPEFSEAKKIGDAAGLYNYESMIIKAMHGKQKINNTAAVWYGKNRFGWTDRQEVDHKSDGEKVDFVFNLVRTDAKDD